MYCFGTLTFEGEGVLNKDSLLPQSFCFPNCEVESCALTDDRAEPFLQFSYWSDDCPQPSLVSIWQSNVPYTQVVKVLEKYDDDGDDDDNDHDDNDNNDDDFSLVQPAAICASSFTLVAICSER